MKRTTWAGLLAALTLFVLGTGTASANIINFSFKNSGSVADADLCGFNCLLVTTTGTAEETGGLPGANEWSFTGVMKFSSTSLVTLEGNGTGTGLGWSFMDTSGNNNLYGSFSSDLFTLLGIVSAGTVDYTIGGGSGLFAGATGFGASTIKFIGGDFWETGLMHVVTANLTSVPEPGVIVLFLTAGGLLALAYQRRRRAAIQH
jgi:hypothetical protein